MPFASDAVQLGGVGVALPVFNRHQSQGRAAADCGRDIVGTPQCFLYLLHLMSTDLYSCSPLSRIGALNHAQALPGSHEFGVPDVQLTFVSKQNEGPGAGPITYIAN